MTLQPRALLKIAKKRLRSRPILKALFNPCHDAQGRFCSGGGGGGAIPSALAYEMRRLTKQDGRERAVIIDSAGNRGPITIGDEGSTDFGFHPNMNKEGANLHVVHTHPGQETLSSQDIGSLARHAGVYRISAILPDGEIHTVSIIGNRDELYRRNDALFLEVKTKVLDRHIAGEITTKDGYDRELRRQWKIALGILSREGLIRYQIARRIQENVQTHAKTPILAIHRQVNRYDPTKTLTIRNAFARDMAARFAKLKRAIRTAIVDEDCFGLEPGVDRRILVQAEVTTPGRSAFDFPRSSDKVAAFMAWLEAQVNAGILEVTELPRIGGAIEGAWTNKYISDTYSRGVARARYELKKAGYGVPDLEATGGIHAALSSPPHVDRLGVLYTRSFQELKGITAAMDTQISRVLAQGIADGDNPIPLAKKLLAAIDGKGMGDLGITDSLGRFIPAERRAKMLARTEIIRAHAQAQLQEYKNWAAAGVTADVEFVNAGFNVCPVCVGLQGKVYTIEQAMNVIPVHPHCRCAWLPSVRGEGKEGKAPPATVVEPEFDQTQVRLMKAVNDLPGLEENTGLEDIYLKKMVEIRGFDKLPETINPSQADDLIRKGNTELWRTFTTKDDLEKFVKGDFFVGMRETPEGGGIFTTPTKQVAQRIKGELARMVLDKDANMARLDPLEKLRLSEFALAKDKLEKRFAADVARTLDEINKPGADVSSLSGKLALLGQEKDLAIRNFDRIYGNPARFAVFKGYAGIIDNEYQTIIFDRAKLKVVETSAPKLELVNLNASEGFATKIRSFVDQLSDKVRDVIAEAGYKIQSSVFVSDAFPRLKNVHPRGWGSLTWDAADGLHNSSGNKTILVCEKTRSGGREFLGTRPAETFFHETGHAFDYASRPGTNWTSDLESIKIAYNTDIALFGPEDRVRFSYLLQSGYAGRQEAFAEVFAALHGRTSYGSVAMMLEKFKNLAAIIREMI